MAYYQNWVTRFVLRKDFFRRVNSRLQLYSRKLRKDEFEDLTYLLADREPRTIFDCGANVGFVTNQFRRMFPGATVHAFEPNPTVFAPLKDTFAGDAQVHAVQMAISRVPGTLMFNQNANTGTSSFFTPTQFNRSHWARRKSESIEVEVTTIDAYAAAHDISSIDILKLDLEGAEADALLGAERMLNAHAIDVIHTEVALVPLYEKQPLFEDLIMLLRARGYFLYNIYDFNESAIRQAILGNAIFISSRFREQLTQKWGSADCGW